MTLASFAPLVNHLWQSTLFGLAVWFLTLMLRHGRAALRYRLWMVASLKFLIPLSLLVDAGRSFAWRWAPAAAAAWSAAVEEVLAPQPAPIAAVARVAVPAPSNVVPLVLSAIWLVGIAGVLFSWWRQWRPIRAALGRAWPAGGDLSTAAQGMDVMLSPDRFEPGIVGILRPVLLLPDGIADRLSTHELRAIVAHERCHVHRRDNLTAALHMAVEAVFWFHPGVWWIEGRLVEERERACDEAVLDDGNEPQTYAEAILSVGRHYVESPTISAAGVTGSNLKHRVERIMRNRPAQALGLWKRSTIGLAAIAAIVGPIAVGALSAPRLDAQAATNDADRLEFEAAIVKPNTGADRTRRAGYLPGGRFVGINVSLRMLLGAAFSSPDAMLPNFRIVGGPSWLDTDGFDVEAKAASGDAKEPQLRLMLQSLLAEHFKLASHNETQQLPMYDLVLARADGRLGPQLRRSAGECGYAAPVLPAGLPNCNDRFGPARMAGLRFTIGDVTMEALAARLESRVVRHVVDRTALVGKFDVDVEYTAATVPPADPFAAPLEGLSIFTALQEQLGLKLQATTGPVQVLVIDHAERPAESSVQLAAPVARRSQPAAVRPVRSVQASKTGVITGRVTDSSSGDPLAGVSVEIVSDIPDGKPRTVVTGADGSYRADDLPPAIYTVTLTHADFTTFKREGLRVAAEVTSRVDVAMRESHIRD